MPAPTIVCGVDGSDNASAAVSFARILSGWLDWRLVVVHVVDPPVIPGVSLVPGGYDELLESSKEQGVELVDAKGAPVAATLEGFRGLKPGSTITVEGEVRREGKDNKLVRVVATRFYPG